MFIEIIRLQVRALCLDKPIPPCQSLLDGLLRSSQACFVLVKYQPFDCSECIYVCVQSVFGFTISMHIQWITCWTTCQCQLMLRSKPTFGETFFRLSHGSSVAVMGQSAMQCSQKTRISRTVCAWGGKKQNFWFLCLVYRYLEVNVEIPQQIMVNTKSDQCICRLTQLRSPESPVRRPRIFTRGEAPQLVS